MSRGIRKQFPLGGGPWLAIPGVGGIFDSGTTVPSNGALGFAPGCLFVDNDAAAGLQLWINEGTAASAAFKVVPSSASGTFASLIVTALTATNATVSSAFNMAANSTITFAANSNAVLNGTNGTQWGTNNAQKQSWWGAAPVIQPATTGVLPGLNGNAATNVNATNMNSNGNLGSTNYSFNDLVFNLKTAGILKS